MSSFLCKHYFYSLLVLHKCFSSVNPKSSKAILMFFPWKRKPQEYEVFTVWHVILWNAAVYTLQRTCNVHVIFFVKHSLDDSPQSCVETEVISGSAVFAFHLLYFIMHMGSTINHPRGMVNGFTNILFRRPPVNFFGPSWMIFYQGCTNDFFRPCPSDNEWLSPY